MTEDSTPEKTLAKTIDCTPTWSAMLPILLIMLDEGSIRAQTSAKEELRRMALIADEYVKLKKAES